MGMTYLLHFSEKLAHSQHYIGWCNDKRLPARIKEHQAGHPRSSKITKAAVANGIELQLVRVWPNTDRAMEKKLKKRKNAKKLCPICNPDEWRQWAPGPVPRDEAEESSGKS